MNSFLKGLSHKDTNLSFANKATVLNPNAAEFVPSSLRSTFANTSNADNKSDVAGASEKTPLTHSESNAFNISDDDEAHQFWNRQLPDDITPDFKAIGEEETQGPENLLMEGLSIHDGNGSTRFFLPTADQILNIHQEMMPLGANGISLNERVGYSEPIFNEDQVSSAFMTSSAWEKQLRSSNHVASGKNQQSYNGDFGDRGVFLNDLSNLASTDVPINPLEFLASQFPGFSVDSLTEFYYANGCDLSLTIEILTQLELQVDGAFVRSQGSKTMQTPNLGLMDFPALTVADAPNALSKYARDGCLQPLDAYKTSTMLRGATDFASAVRKHSAQDPVQWKNGSLDYSVGSSRSSSILSGSYNGHRKTNAGEKFLGAGAGAARASPVWVETGEAVANMYSESREEARDLARLRNTYLEQARQAYLIGNKALAKDLSVKGQVLNMQMKAAHGKARETIYRQRNPAGLDLQNYGRDQDRLIDLHGLHVNEAIHVLKQELSTLKSAARTLGQRFHLMICVGTGHHTKGSRTPARLPVAIEQYLLEESLHYTIPQPGLLRVMIC